MNYTCAEEKVLATKLRFKCVPDRHRGGCWCMFKKAQWMVWCCARGWATAEMDGGYYKRHEYFENLEDALLRVNKELKGILE